MSRPDYVAPLPSNPAVVARSRHYSDTSVTFCQTLPVSVLPTVPSTVPVTLGAHLQAQSYQTTNPSPHWTAVPYPAPPSDASHNRAVMYPHWPNHLVLKC